MDETLVIAALLNSRGAYNALHGKLSLADFSDHAQQVLKAGLAYYRNDESAQSVDRRILATTLGRVYPNPKHSDSLLEYFASIPTEVSAGNAAAMYLEVRQRRAALSLADSILKGSDRDAVAKHILAYQALGPEGADAGERKDKLRLTYDDIYTEDRQGKIKVYPARLNDVLRGGIRPGHNLLIFGRPGAGKTLVTVNLVAGMAHAGARVLYCANEEPVEEITRRFLSRLGGVSLWDLNHENLETEKANFRAAEQRALARGYANVFIQGDVSSTEDIRRLVAEVRPDVLVVDQIRHVDQKLDMVSRQEHVTRFLRETAHSAKLIAIGTAQAGGAAENKPVIGLTGVDFSLTGVQGACDLMMGVAVTEDMERQHKRMLCICRNKISGTKVNFPVWLDELHTAVRSKPA